MSKDLLFISGAARSGTTAVAKLLNRHPQILLGSERYFFKLAKQELKPSDFELPRFLKIEDGDTHEAGRVAQNREAYDRSKIVGDKFPQPFLYMDYIEETFPSAKHVYIVRNPFSVAESYEQRRITGSWRHSYMDAVRAWNRSISTFQRLAPALRGRLHVVEYEDLFGNPESIQAMLRFLDVEPLSPAVLESEIAQSNKVSAKEAMRNDALRLYVCKHTDWAAYAKFCDTFGLNASGG